MNTKWCEKVEGGMIHKNLISNNQKCSSSFIGGLVVHVTVLFMIAACNFASLLMFIIVRQSRNVKVRLKNCTKD